MGRSRFLALKRRSDNMTASTTNTGSPPLKKRMISSASLLPQLNRDGDDDKKAARGAIEAQHADLGARHSGAACSAIPNDIQDFNVEEYIASRSRVVKTERDLDFDARCRLRSSALETKVDAILHRLRQQDEEKIYEPASPRDGYAGQKHARFAGDHFLSNVDLIEQTALYNVASHMPKGAHLHIHFNACLRPSVLLNIAKDMDRMFITSDLPLTSDNDYANYNQCELQFSITSPDREVPGNLFARDYQPRQTMAFADFLRQFPNHFSQASADEWLLEKLLFHEDEAHGVLQTAEGAWEKFNGRTRMMKGLFNYETAYRRYTRLCLEDFMRDNIQYAEIRPNFMSSNQLYTDDGTGLIDNRGIMEIIISEVARFQKEMTDQGRFFGGLKVIYTTPRSLAPSEVKIALDECIAFKKQWPTWIAGFDLAGEEGKGRPLKDFIAEFLAFKKQCAKEGLDIPFLFHCGETLDLGGETDGNLVDALLLGAKRIGHGFALTKHPYVMQQMKAQGVCLELCPISNEILGLTPRASGHSMYPLLANNVHCTVNSDNGALFRSSLSHDFYQVMIGRSDLGLYGWKQLVLWSMQHACLDEAERQAMLAQWEPLWERFLLWVVETYESTNTRTA